MGWDRAAWLLVSSSGVPKLEWLERLAKPDALWAALTSINSFSSAAEFALAAAYALVYFFGRIWLWLVLAIVLIFRPWASSDVSRVKRGVREAVFVALTPALAGVAAELLKLISRRERPELSDGMYSFRAPSVSPIDPDFWSTSGLGLASSHASVAVAAALAAGVLFPRLRVALFGLAALCCLSRALVGAHYLSDVYVGATLAWLVFVAIYAWDRRNNAGSAIAS
jgi:membrane-associated phospholipid phosphatase